MAKWKTWVRDYPQNAPDLFDSAALLPRYKTDLRWPAHPSQVIRVWDLGKWPYTVDVEISRDDDDNLAATGITIRRNFPTDGRGARFETGAKPLPVSPRDVRRMPLDAIVKAALVAATTNLFDPERHTKLRRALRTRGRPKRGKSQKFYAAILADHRELTRRGESAGKAIAEREGVDVNTVYQWIYRARHPNLGA
jgi:hypothetical protein